MTEPLLTAFSLALAGLEFATWMFAFETRKTFRGGIFWNAWRIIASALLFLMCDQLVVMYGAATSESDILAAIGESFEAAGAILLLVGFYLFYRAWNPSGLQKRS